MLSARRQTQLNHLIAAQFASHEGMQYQELGNGDIHVAYEVTWPQQPAMVVKFRKRFPYGEVESHSASLIAGEYKGTQLFYQALAGSELAVPQCYQSGQLDGQFWVIESKLEQAVAFADFTSEQAHQAGCTLARALLSAYKKPAPCDGMGKLLLTTEGGLQGQNETAQQLQYQFEKQRFINLIKEISVEAEAAALIEALTLSYELQALHEWPLTLVNEDIHPENLVLQHNGQLAVMDPQVSIDSGLRFLAHFWLNCAYFWPLLLGDNMTQQDEQAWVANLAPLGEGFLQTCITQHVPKAAFYAEAFLRQLYLLWRHQEYVCGRSEQGSDTVLGSVHEARARIPALLNQLQALSVLLLEAHHE
ncbi:hypothetical protein [Pseudoalteromonas piscicida]|uniref:hypothetical protein n=1 Tax=Pseudoalteromonas piscicida TaxID=43662 RepID=UPI0015521630|nr:hypothetical protein [Pseudoalteromonas piscicida]